MPLRYELLQLIVNPTVAFLLLTIGVIGLAIELFSPGTFLPGGIGLVSLLLGLYGTAQIPVRTTGVLLLVLAAGLIIAEAHLATGGVLGLAGIGALIASSLLLYDTDSDAFGVSPPIVVAAAALLGRCWRSWCSGWWPPIKMRPAPAGRRWSGRWARCGRR